VAVTVDHRVPERVVQLARARRRAVLVNHFGTPPRLVLDRKLFESKPASDTCEQA
jgi:hypothetical protein